MDEEKKEEGLQNMGDEQLKEELVKREEKKCEDIGKKIEEKIDAIEKKVPRPINSFFDALCLSVFIVGAAWLLRKIGWLGQMPAWTVFGIIFCGIFAISLVYRLMIKSPSKKAG